MHNISVQLILKNEFFQKVFMRPIPESKSSQNAKSLASRISNNFKVFKVCATMFIKKVVCLFSDFVENFYLFHFTTSRIFLLLQKTDISSYFLSVTKIFPPIPGHSILRHFDVLLNFLFTTRETDRNY